MMASTPSPPQLVFGPNLNEYVNLFFHGQCSVATAWTNPNLWGILHIPSSLVKQGGISFMGSPVVGEKQGMEKRERKREER